MKRLESTSALSGANLVFSRAGQDWRVAKRSVAWGQFEQLEEQGWRQEWVRRWTELIDNELIEWGRDPSQLEDDESEAPTPSTISRAAELAYGLRDSDLPPPTRIVSTGNGEIRFQYDQGGRFTSIVISNNAAPEILEFENGRLNYRGAI
ncbi:MAG TPA: hypothetical protein VND64_11680 [Pirellulales bacterium]|nr:hypothetical protein [Pirellulales bacterium]